MLAIMRKRCDAFLNSNLGHWLDTLLLYTNVSLVIFQNSSFVANPKNFIVDEFLYVFLFVFIFEAAIRFLASGWTFFTDYRNIFTITVLSICVYFDAPDLTVLLALRSLRAWRTLDFIPKTRHIIDALYHALPGVINVIFLIIFVFIIFAALGVHFFGNKVPELWGNFTQSFITLQQIMLSDDWGTNLRATTKFYPYSGIFFLSFLIINSFVLLNLFIGVIVDAMQTAQEEKNLKDTAITEKQNVPFSQINQRLQKMERQLEAIKKALEKAR